MVDAHDSKSCSVRSEGSSPSSGTDSSIAQSGAGSKTTACLARWDLKGQACRTKHSEYDAQSCTEHVMFKSLLRHRAK